MVRLGKAASSAILVAVLGGCEPPPPPQSEPCPDLTEAREGLDDLIRRAREAGVSDDVLAEAMSKGAR